MFPFSVTFRGGVPVHDQVVYAVKKAVVSGRLRPGDPFPSVRAMSQHLRINPNTAQKVVATLTGQGLLEVRPGIGTFVTKAASSSAAERRALLSDEVERLVVEAKKLSLDVGDLTDAVRDHWSRLSGSQPRSRS